MTLSASFDMRKWRCHLSLIVLFHNSNESVKSLFPTICSMKLQFKFMDKDSKRYLYVQRNKDKPSDTFNNRKTIKQWIFKNIWSFDPCSFHAELSRSCRIVEFSLNIDEGKTCWKLLRWIIICCCYCLLDPGALCPVSWFGPWAIWKAGSAANNKILWLEKEWITPSLNFHALVQISGNGLLQAVICLYLIVHNIAVGKSLFTTNSLTFDPLQLLEVDPHPSFFPMSGKICRWQVECNIQCDPGI